MSAGVKNRWRASMAILIAKHATTSESHKSARFDAEPVLVAGRKGSRTPRIATQIKRTVIASPAIMPLSTPTCLFVNEPAPQEVGDHTLSQTLDRLSWT